MKSKIGPLESWHGASRAAAVREVSGRSSEKAQSALDNSPRVVAQRRRAEEAFGEIAPNLTGMPDALKSGVEALSGVDMSDVRVHKNSTKPAQLNALAYAQGTDIHLGPGQEKHLPHEAWHVAQQSQGRVKPTLQSKGVAINDDAGLEREADRLGAQAAQMKAPRFETSADSHMEEPRSSRSFQFKSEAIQFTKWKWDGSKWVPQGDQPDYSKSPKWKGKKFNEVYDDDPQEAQTGEPSLAEQARGEWVQPYLDLLGHLAGEIKDGNPSGGHLLHAMRSNFGETLEMKGDAPSDSVWNLRWKVGNSSWKDSTMFPQGWTAADLENQLRNNSERIGGSVYISGPPRMRLNKTGDTFYPELAE